MLALSEKEKLIPFNKPYIGGKELYYIAQAVTYGNISGDGFFTRRCCKVLQERLNINKVLLTPSCTGALEMSALLCGLQPGDEVIMPSFTFVSTANAFVRVGAVPVFVDIRPDTLNMDEQLIEEAITDRTRAIVPVHYAGVGCEMNTILSIARRHDLHVIEDAAQGVDAYYEGKALGSFGDLGCFSFHETKNLTCGEGGAICLNSPEFVERAEIIHEKGTNRSKFFRGEVDKYTWVEVGSSYVPSEIACAFLLGQLEMMDAIAAKRRAICKYYLELLASLAERRLLRLPETPASCQGNHHMFYVLLADGEQRDRLLNHLKRNHINAVFHYVPLHSSPMGSRVARTHGTLGTTERVSQCLLRLPCYYEISPEQQARVASSIGEFFSAGEIRKHPTYWGNAVA
jgi:dTDP-4-amino-4,6-dideoxygalactose transaminase